MFNCRVFLWFKACILASLLLPLAACGAQQDTAAPSQVTADVAFEGAVGWAAVTVGGRGGSVIKVTSLAANGPGSLREALAQAGPRIVVFEVGGVIDLEGKELRIAEPFVTIAGQTAPSPGITLIKGGIVIGTHDVIIRHLRVRPGDLGEPLGSGRDIDAITTWGAANVIIDHNSLTWATDENLSASGKRFIGDTAEEWRRAASHNITFSNNIIAEGLSYSTHAKGEHSKGSLIHDNTSGLAIVGNLYAHNFERSPLLKGGVHAALINNFIYDPGQRAVHYNLQGLEWAGMPHEPGRLTMIGNVMRGGPSTHGAVPMLMLGGDGDLQLHAKDNIAIDRYGAPLPLLGRYTTGRAQMRQVEAILDMPPAVTILAAEDVERAVLANVGARPWDRDWQDVRVLANAAEGRGEIIDSQEEVGGYPDVQPTYRAFDAALWDLATMDPVSPAALDDSAKHKGT